MTSSVESERSMENSCKKDEDEKCEETKGLSLAGKLFSSLKRQHFNGFNH